MDLRRTVAQLSRYGVTGGVGLVLNLSLLVLLVDLLGIGESVAALLSAGVTLSVTFLATERWVFGAYVPDGDTRSLRRAPIYYLVMVSGKAVNYAVYLALLSVGVWYPVSWAAGSVAVFGGTFLLNRFVWRRTTRVSGK